MAKQEQIILYKCPIVKKKVRLNIYADIPDKKFLFAPKPTSQEVKKCDLQSMGGCQIRIDTYDSKCPAVQLAGKCGLK